MQLDKFLFTLRALEGEYKMREFSIEMPEVKKCEVSQCVYNMENNCHARAITVGDGSNAMCDTFADLSMHNSRREIAGVGACKVSSCTFNNDYECQAENITIGKFENQAKCTTYAAR